MQYAVIETGGKQYKVKTGDVLQVENLGIEDGKKITLDKVMLLVNDGKAEIGMPYLKDVTVDLKVMGSLKGDKIRVAKFKAKSRYRRVQGHRQQLSEVLVEAIKSGKTEVKAPVKKTAAK